MFPFKSLSLAVALTAAAGAALAGPADNQPTPGVYRSAPPPTHSISYSAAVTPKGKLAHGDGATGASLVSKGAYEVDFVSDVSQCSYVATLGQSDKDDHVAPGFVTVVSRANNSAAIYIQTYDVTGHIKNEPFQIDVGC